MLDMLGLHTHLDAIAAAHNVSIYEITWTDVPSDEDKVMLGLEHLPDSFYIRGGQWSSHGVDYVEMDIPSTAEYEHVMLVFYHEVGHNKFSCQDAMYEPRCLQRFEDEVQACRYAQDTVGIEWERLDFILAHNAKVFRVPAVIARKICAKYGYAFDPNVETTLVLDDASAPAPMWMLDARHGKCCGEIPEKHTCDGIDFLCCRHCHSSYINEEEQP